MRRNAISLAGFDAKFRESSDPWNTWSARFEAVKRGVLAKAIGTRLYGRGLELAGGNGSNTVMIASRVRRLCVTDGAQAAAALMHEIFAGCPNIAVVQHDVAERLPAHRFDLIVIAELLYYLDERRFATLAKEIDRTLVPGGRLVLLHHEEEFADRARRAGTVHRDFIAAMASPMGVASRCKARLWRAESFDRALKAQG